eukprot:TRINITY_DN1835_c0_g1_i8.p1 TRINITY_DN1835_c0_g1~~TRINITY_DN1835_c0_g1_i8.p1  ORF type:complete len:154 (-),score=19.82 TRINITY_DN1835_c0_g1_i8:85-546(-)
MCIRDRILAVPEQAAVFRGPRAKEKGKMSNQSTTNQNANPKANQVHESERNLQYEMAYELNKCKIYQDNAQIATIIADVLEQIVLESENIQEESSYKQFQAKTVPSISVKDYLVRIAKFSHCSQECLIFALIYIDRLLNNTCLLYTSPSPRDS